MQALRQLESYVDIIDQGKQVKKLKDRIEQKEVELERRTAETAKVDEQLEDYHSSLKELETLQKEVVKSREAARCSLLHCESASVTQEGDFGLDQRLAEAESRVQTERIRGHPGTETIAAVQAQICEVQRVLTETKEKVMFGHYVLYYGHFKTS